MMNNLATKVFASQVVPNTEDTSIGDVMAGGLNYLMFFVGVAAIAGIVYGGVLMITSAGNPERLQKAKRSIMWSIAGVVLVVLAFAIVNFISTIVGGGN